MVLTILLIKKVINLMQTTNECFYKVKNSELIEDSDEIPCFPNSFQKHCWKLSNFTPLIPYDIFWYFVHKGIKLADYECKLNLDAFSVSSRKAYHDLYS